MNAHTQYIYTVMVIDASRFKGHREETVLGFAHTVDEHTLMIHVGNERDRVWYNFRWVLGFSRVAAEYSEARSVLG